MNLEILKITDRSLKFYMYTGKQRNYKLLHIVYQISIILFAFYWCEVTSSQTASFYEPLFCGTFSQDDVFLIITILPCTRLGFSLSTREPHTKNIHAGQIFLNLYLLPFFRNSFP